MLIPMFIWWLVTNYTLLHLLIPVLVLWFYESHKIQLKRTMESQSSQNYCDCNNWEQKRHFVIWTSNTHWNISCELFFMRLYTSARTQAKKLTYTYSKYNYVNFIVHCKSGKLLLKLWPPISSYKMPNTYSFYSNYS